VGLSGRDDQFMRARRLEKVQGRSASGEPILVDLGRVGDVEHVNPNILEELMSNGFVPVVAPIAVDSSGAPLNVNADTAAGRIAAALGAAKLMLMTDVEGVKDKSGSLISSLAAREAEHLITEEVIRAGMIPKVQCALEAVSDGVEKVHIIDGRRRHALLLEIFTDRGVGTEIQRAAAG
jgi:acetylglutamate kinase